MGSVSRGRWRREVWGALAPTNGMASWAWLLAAVLLSLLTVSVARPPLTATKEEATLEPEGKQWGTRRTRKKRAGEVEQGGKPFVGVVFREQVYLCQDFPPSLNMTLESFNFCIFSCSNLTCVNFILLINVSPTTRGTLISAVSHI